MKFDASFHELDQLELADVNGGGKAIDILTNTARNQIIWRTASVAAYKAAEEIKNGNYPGMPNVRTEY